MKHATVGGRDGGNLHPGAKTKNEKIPRVQIVHFYRLLQIDVISKRENSLCGWYTTGLDTTVWAIEY